MAQNFGTEYDSLLLAIRGGAPDPSNWAGSVSLKRSPADSANHRLQTNPIEALEGIRTGKATRTQAVLDWAEEYYLGTPLQEGVEDLTPNVAYRPAITNGTLILAGIASEVGRVALAEKLLDRCRSDVFWIILGAGTGPAKEITNHHKDKVGEAFLYVGDGPRVSAVPGLPYFVQAGKRGHVRAGGHANHVEEIEDTLGLGISTLVSQATGLGNPPKFIGELFRAIRSRWPSLEPYGLNESDRLLAKHFINDPTNVALARQVAVIAGGCRPSLSFSFVRYADGSVVSFCHESDGSSTGCRMVDELLSDGTHYIGSADTGSRGTKGNPGAHVQPQTCTEEADQLVCRWKSGEGKTIRVPKPTAREVYRVRTQLPGISFLAADDSAYVPPPVIPPPETSSPWFVVRVREMNAAECASTGAVLGSHLISANSAEASIKEIWPGGPDELRRWVVEP